MDKHLKLEEFKKEFSEELENVSVSVDDLKKRKIASSVLAAETFLRKIFGDELYVEQKKESVVTGEKEIVKLSEEDMSFDAQVREICDSIEDYEFDNNVGTLVSKANIGG